MTKDELIEMFNTVRDIPYSIPLSYGAEDNCCSGKHERLKKMLEEMGYNARYRVCVFLWDDLGLPDRLNKIPHDEDCTHVYLEVEIGGRWTIVDVTWDMGLKDVLPVNEWDGESDMEIAVKPIEIFDLDKSLEIMNDQGEKTINDDLAKNGEFYKAFNGWLEEVRN